MGHTAPIQCPECSAIQHIELKDAGIDDEAATVTYTFTCECGFTHVFDNAPMEDVIPFLSDLPESEWFGSADNS